MGLGHVESPWVAKIYFALIFILLIKLALPINIFSLCTSIIIEKNNKNKSIVVFHPVLAFPCKFMCSLSLLSMLRNYKIPFVRKSGEMSLAYCHAPNMPYESPKSFAN